LFRAQHPVEKIKRVAIGPLTVEGISRGRYRMVGEKEVQELRKVIGDRKAASGERRAGSRKQEEQGRTP